MRFFYLVLACFCVSPMLAQTGRVGIGTLNPQTRFHVADSSVLFSSTVPWFLPGNPHPIPIEGEGTRFLWYDSRAAIRAGAVSSSAWNQSNIGKYSVGFGLDVRATGDYSTAIGVNNEARNWYGIAMGAENYANEVGSLALGMFNYAENSQAMVIGSGLRARTVGSVVLGAYNDTTDAAMPIGFAGFTDRIFQVGNGNTINRSNAITVLRNGRTGVGTVLPRTRLHVDQESVLFTGSEPWFLPNSNTEIAPIEGEGVRFLWYGGKAALRAGAVSGQAWNNANIGNYSVAFGIDNRAAGLYSFAAGLNNSAIASHSVALGNANQANQTGTVAIGSGNVVRNFSGMAFGNSLVVKPVNGVALGVSNDTSDVQRPVGSGADTDRLFQIGNGFGNTRSNAMTVLFNGNVGIGTVNPARPLSFPPTLGEKILLYPGVNGEVGIGVYGNELRLHCDNPGSKVSLGTQDNFGTFTELARAQQNGAIAFSVNGSIWANGTVYASDQRFKHNVMPLTNALDQVLKLRGVSYHMQVDEFPQQHFASGTQIGLLAQEVEQVVPEVVKVQNGYKGVDYAQLVPLLIEAVKSQQVRINELEARLAKMEH